MNEIDFSFQFFFDFQEEVCRFAIKLLLTCPDLKFNYKTMINV